MIPPAYCLVCNELPERTATCKAHFAERGVSVTFWRGIHGRSWGLRTVHEFDPGQTLPPGHVGLNLGVWNLWQHIWLSGQERDADPNQPVLVFEDDATLPGDFKKELGRVLVELDECIPDWDLVFLGLAEVEPHVWNKVTERIGQPDSRLCRMNDPFGTHALMIRRRALPVLLDNMAIAHRNLDQQLWARVLKPGLLKWCAVLPSLVTQRTFDYVGSGKPEWAPSCVHESDPKPQPTHVLTAEASPYSPRGGILAHTHEAKRLAGAKVPQVDLPGRPTPELIRATSALIDQFSCLYRGEPLEDDGTSSSGRSVPVNQCARLNQACHTRFVSLSGRVKMPGGQEAVACETCGHRQETSSNIERDRLPLPMGHFNPSMLEYNGKLIFASRDSWGHSKVALWELNNSHPDWTGKWSVSPIGSFASSHPEAPRLEDPRLFIHDGVLCGAFNLPDGYPPKLVQVGYCRFAPDLSGITDTVVFRSPMKSVYEKNWSPFEQDGELRWIYSMKPDHLVLGEKSNHSTQNPFPWTGGVLRGGAAPVLHKGKYFTFFHGCLKRLTGNIYSVGCYTFSPEPPYRILKQTPIPLLWPDQPGKDENVVKRFVCWVGGAVYHAGAWFLAIGVDDSFCKIVRIPEAVVETALSDVPEAEFERTTSIRNSPIATGFKQTERV